MASTSGSKSSHDSNNESNDDSDFNTATPDTISPDDMDDSLKDILTKYSVVWEKLSEY